MTITPYLPIPVPHVWQPLTTGLFLSVLGFAVSRVPRKKPSKKSSALHKLIRLAASRADLLTILDEALELIVRLVETDAGSICLFDSSGNRAGSKISRGSNGSLISFLSDCSDEAAGKEGSALLPALTWTNGAIPGPAGPPASGAAVQFYVAVQLKSDSRLYGLLQLAGCAPMKLSAEKAEFLAACADILAIACENAVLRESSAKFSEDLVTLQEVNKIISQSFDLEDSIRRIVVEGKRLVKSSDCHLFLLEDRPMRLVGSASTQMQSFEIRKLELELSSLSYPGRSLSERKVLTVPDGGEKNLYTAALMEKMSWKAAIFAPLVYKDQGIGVLVFSHREQVKPFSPEEIFRAETLSHQAAIALENARLFHVVSRSHKEWETTFDAMPDCVSVHDISGRVIRANVALAKRLKTTPPKVITRLCCEIYHPHDTTVAPCSHLPVLGSEGLLVEEIELPAMGGTFQLSVTPWFDKNNRLAGSIHVAKDISNEKHLRLQLIQSEKLSAIGQLISGIAHELNNPLTGVMGYSQLLQLRKDIDERAKESLAKINNLALRCQKIVQNLLSFARKQKPERTLCDINEILERTVELRGYDLQVNNIEIRRELDCKIPHTIADAHQLQQVFLNLITNAEQAMLESNGRGMLAIRSRWDQQAGRIVVEISDDGPGIPEPLLSRIFDPFFTTKEVGRGTGLGLSLSYGIVKEHGGSIYAWSRPGNGSTFYVELPVIARVHQETAPAPELMPRAIHFENAIRNRRILVVDDERYILEFFVEVFKMYAMEVDTANDGKLAKERILEKDYDIVITDFKMPLVSGKELYQWITDNRPALTNRVIFVTGDTASYETQSFFEKTGSRYIAKPFKIDEVKEAIQETLEKSSESASSTQ
jgi:two-component system, NtrC family, sensor kinase